MCAKDVVIGECVRVAKAQVNVGLSGKVEDGINLVAFKTIHDFGGVCNIAMVEAKVPLVIERPGIVERSAVVQLVERDNIIGIRICHGQMSHQPTSTLKSGNLAQGLVEAPETDAHRGVHT